MKIKALINLFINSPKYFNINVDKDLDRVLEEIYKNLMGKEECWKFDKDCTMCCHVFNLRERFEEELKKRLSLEDLIRYRLYK